MKKPYTFRLDPNLIKKLDTFDGTRTFNVELSIQHYVQSGCSNSYNDNTAYVQHLESEIVYLRDQNDKLLISSVPLFSRIKLKLLSK